MIYFTIQVYFNIWMPIIIKLWLLFVASKLKKIVEIVRFLYILINSFLLFNDCPTFNFMNL